MRHRLPIIHTAAAMLAALLAFMTPLTSTAATDGVTAGRFHIERPTLVCAGFEWTIEGDDNRSASVAVSYRKKGTAGWTEGMPLFRLQREHVTYPRTSSVPVDYTTPNMFAGSIFDLEPGTEYECRFVLGDPDGVSGESEKTVTVATRPVPAAYGGGRTLHVYPPDFEGPREEPSFSSISEAYYGPGRGYWGSARVEPGDIILVHAGLYKANINRYVEPLGLHFHGAYILSKKGTPDKPIVIRGAGDGEAVLDGAGCYRLFDAMFADHTWFENLTIRNCDIGIYAGVRFLAGSKGIVVRNCRFEEVGCAVNAQYIGCEDFYIADNVIIGRDDRTRLHGWTGSWRNYGPLANLDSFIAIDINGRGHAVCHNYIAYFHDGIDVTEQGQPETEDPDLQASSIDFYNNDIHMMADDFIEADCGVHNIRVFDNRCINAAQHGLSAQPIYGGPAYFIRNLVYHVPAGGAFKFNIYPSGVVVLHNTLCSEWTTSPPFSNVYVRNNLFLGSDHPGRPILRVATMTSYTSFDYDGYRPNADAPYQFGWTSPGGGRMTDWTLRDDPFKGTFDTLGEFSEATGQETHGITVDYDIFVDAAPPDPLDPGRLYSWDDIDLGLRPGSAAVDAGCVMPGINDGYAGSAPDLGALESGRPRPVYGPRTGK